LKLSYVKYAKLRDKKGETDYQVAIGAGVTKSTFTAWRKKDYTPKLEKGAKIAKYFGVPLEELLEE